MNTTILKFIQFYKPYRKQLFTVLFCALLSAGLSLLVPLLVRYITHTVLEGLTPNPLQALLLAFFALCFLRVLILISEYLQDAPGHILGATMQRDMRAQIFEKLQHQSFHYFDEQRVGSLMSRITNDLYAVGELAHHLPENILVQGLRFFGSFIILACINLKLTLSIFACMPIILAIAWLGNKALSKNYSRNKERMAEINAQIEDSLAGVKMMQSFNNYHLEKEKFDLVNNLYLKNRARTYRLEAALWVGMEAVTSFLLYFLLLFAGREILKGSLPLADLITYMLYLDFLVQPIHVMSYAVDQYQEGITGFKRFLEVMEAESEIKDCEGAKPLKVLCGEICFDAVSFQYDKSAEMVLDNISLTIHPGELVALVGASGVGKSTLSALIPRFYDVSGGRVCIDGQDVREVSLDSLRAEIGFVQQETYLFFDSILENIRYGRPDASDEAVYAAARMAGLHDFIVSLPKAYLTQVGERGVRLSGGQRQRVSLARLFLKNPKIMVFDEATSSLDNESEQHVQRSIHALAKGRSTLIIAHRLSTVEHADRIIVLDKGRIAEEGKHSELVIRNGVYARLYKLSKREEIFVDLAQPGVQLTSS
ncbi:MAG: ABC transporter ATP-binding protein [Anaerolineaceae bacterium]|nr:ABC transporter ATP-binding protein [Anaerolineaceae bacterium]